MRSSVLIAPLCLAAPAAAWAQPQPVEVEATGATTAVPKSAEEQLRELRAMRAQMQREMGVFDQRINALEVQLQGTAPASSAPVETATAQPVPDAPPLQTGGSQPAGTSHIGGEYKAGEGSFYEPGRGFILVRGDEGELGTGVFSYVRYLNQTALKDTYTDSFGRTLPLSDIRNDIQFQKLSLNFKGWLIDPKFRYYFFLWTSNSQMGEGAQVVLGGYFQYQFSKLLTVTAGIMPLPTTRSTNYTFPNWLRNDNRIMADEFFRGSYTTGIDMLGEITRGLRYRIALGNNLAQLGVSSQELDAKFNTVSGALTWMPTTGEFGPANGMGDFENHQKLATLVEAHYTRSREDAQGQADVDDFENSQIRLSDGTLIFSRDPFGTGGKIQKATYQMAALSAGMKWRGFHLEGEYYWRWVDHFKLASGTIPVTHLFDHGFSLQGSAMIAPKLLQPYFTASKIYGQYGDPSEIALGVNIFPFERKEFRWNFQALKLDRSPVGGTSLPMVVGGDGWVFSTDLIVAF